MEFKLNETSYFKLYKSLAFISGLEYTPFLKLTFGNNVVKYFKFTLINYCLKDSIGTRSYHGYNYKIYGYMLCSPTYDGMFPGSITRVDNSTFTTLSSIFNAGDSIELTYPGHTSITKVLSSILSGPTYTVTLEYPVLIPGFTGVAKGNYNGSNHTPSTTYYMLMETKIDKKFFYPPSTGDRSDFTHSIIKKCEICFSPSVTYGVPSTPITTSLNPNGSVYPLTEEITNINAGDYVPNHMVFRYILEM